VPTTLIRWITGELITGRQESSRFWRRINTELACHASPAAPASQHGGKTSHTPHKPDGRNRKNLDLGAAAETETVNWQSDEAKQ
jgi:hypothetical protein